MEDDKKTSTPDIEDNAGEDAKIGVYVCHCGLNIGGSVDCEAVAEYASGLDNVVYTEHQLYTCSEPGQEKIKQDIAEHGLNRVVVAACSPRMHEPTFRSCVKAAGLNPYLLEMANIREHCSWVHLHDKKEASEKAKDLVAMAVARAKLLRPQEEIEIPVLRRALQDRLVHRRHRRVPGRVELLHPGKELGSVEARRGYQAAPGDQRHKR